MAGRPKNESRERFEVELVEFGPYYGYTSLVLYINLTESNAFNDVATKVQAILTVTAAFFFILIGIFILKSVNSLRLYIV